MHFSLFNIFISKFAGGLEFIKVDGILIPTLKNEYRTTVSASFLEIGVYRGGFTFDLMFMSYPVQIIKILIGKNV